MSKNGSTTARVLYEADSDDLSSLTVISRAIPLGCVLWSYWPLAAIGVFFFFRDGLEWYPLIAAIMTPITIILIFFMISYFSFMLTFFQFWKVFRADAVLYLMLVGALLGGICLGPVFQKTISQSILLGFMPHQLRLFTSFILAAVAGALVSGMLYKGLQSVIHYFLTPKS